MQSVAMALLTTLAVAADAPKGELEGTWDLVRIELDGRAIAPREFDPKQIRFTKCDYEYVANPSPENRPPFAEGRYESYPDRNPKELDLFAKHPQSLDYFRRGIYEIDGDTLRFAMAEPGQPRPRGFGPGLRVEVWKRGRSNTTGQRNMSAPAVAAKAPKGELEGTWELVRIELDGRAIPPGEFDSKQIRFMKCDYEYVPNGISSKRPPFAEGRYESYPDRNPKELDLFAKHPQSLDYFRRGIYEIDGDTLRFAMAEPGRPRPQGFGPGLRVEVWKRGRSNTTGQPRSP